MKAWQKVIVSPATPILKVLEIIDHSALQVALVVDTNNHLLGTVTDGDIRRGILKGISLNEDVRAIMNCNPTIAKANEPRENIFHIMRSNHFRHMPIVDNDGCLVNLEILDNFIKSAKKENGVILMAGGLGKRLYPLTRDCPKPLLKVGDKPILETILETFIEYGFYKFYISVNYKAEMIERYFGNGQKWDVSIQYLRENEPLGTAGALGLLPEAPKEPLLIMNGDLLTKVNFQHLLDFHTAHNAAATMCVREYKFQVPYGVVELEKHRFTGIIEKPIQQFFVNAGVYVLDPIALSMIPPKTFFDMPTLFKKLVENKHETSVFPVREYWLDIGRMSDFEKANGEFSEVFT